MKPTLPALFLITFALAGCQRSAQEPAATPETPSTEAASVPPAEAGAPPAPDATAPSADPAAPPPLQQASLAAYGDMKLGDTAEQAKAGWGGELKAMGNEADACHYLVPKWAKDGNELAFMIEDGRFVRYDVGGSKETAPGGGRVGMGAAELQALYRGVLQATPHKYVEGGQYLSMAASGVAPTKLVFETDAAGKVTRWRVGLIPQADYVEGCS